MTPLPSEAVVLLRDFDPMDDGLLYALGELPAPQHDLVKVLGEAVAQVIPTESPSRAGPVSSVGQANCPGLGEQL